MFQRIQFIVCAVILTAMGVSADVFDDVWGYWELDGGTGGAATTGSIIDASTNGHLTQGMQGTPDWSTEIPATGPRGGAAVSSLQRGLAFDPDITFGDPDTVTPDGFWFNANVDAGATVVMRFKWNGFVGDDANAQMGWLYKNAYGGSSADPRGWMFGIRDHPTVAQLLIPGNGRTSAFTFETNTWYDVALVLEDNGTNDRITFLFCSNATELVVETYSVNFLTNAIATVRTDIGYESGGTGTGNQRKGFKGIIDYVAVWDRPLSESEVRAVMRPDGILDDAVVFYTFDHAPGAVGDASEIADESDANRTAVGLAGTPQWVGNLPASGPSEGRAIGNARQGMRFNPSTVYGATDNVTPDGFLIANGFSVAGDSTLVVRMKWDGYASDDNDALSAWLYRNGHGWHNSPDNTIGTGWLFGVQRIGSDNVFTTHVLGATPNRMSLLPVQTNLWYDVAVVQDDEAGGDMVTFKTWEQGAGYTEQVISGTVYGTALASTTVGGETLGTGGGNARKAFRGTVDFIGLWDRILTDEEIRTVFAPAAGTLFLVR